MRGEESGVQLRWESATREVEQWRCMEWELMSTASYGDPFGEAEVTATFRGPDGSVLVRPAFWDGEASWKIRFAPNVIGKWSLTVTCNDKHNAGLNIDVPWSFNCVPYTGVWELYRRGFLRVVQGDRYFTYADGTPFFYLGDTHWFLPSEAEGRSNVVGVVSQFHHMVDHRVSQGFTVYQSEPLVTSGPHLDCDQGIRESSLELLRNLDRKFAYIADCGLVHANAALTFSSMLQVTDSSLLAKLGRYWVARYGAYPVLWTVAQEIDPDFYNQLDPKYWKQIGRAIHRHDCYKHPMTAHMQYNASSGWANEEGHNWFALQPLDLSKDYMESFWQGEGTKPYLAYETRYEHNNQPTVGARTAAYRAVLNGSYGYGYGVQGVWALNNSPEDWFHYGPYYRWFDGLNAEAGKQMTYFKEFFESLQWWRLKPCFRNTEYGDFCESLDSFLMVDGDRTYVALFTGDDVNGAVLKQMAAIPYEASWYDPRTGLYKAIPGPIYPENGQWVIPPKPDKQDWLLLVVSDASGIQPRLAIRSEDQATIIFGKDRILRLIAVMLPGGEVMHPVWGVTNLDGGPTIAADVDAQGVLMARANGNVRVTVELADRGLSASRTFIIAAQDRREPMQAAQSISIDREGGQFFVRFSPPNTHDQRVVWSVFEQDGRTSTDKVYISPYGVLSCMEGGPVKVVAAAMDGSGLTADYDYDVPNHYDEIVNPLLRGAVASASSSDWVNGYRPGRAIASERGNFTGWTTKVPEHDGELPSPERPQWLAIALQKPTVIKRLDLYTTGAGLQLRDFDIENWDGEQWSVLAEVRDNNLTEVILTFAPVSSVQLRILCYKGDMMGIARIGAIEIYGEETM